MARRMIKSFARPCAAFALLVLLAASGAGCAAVTPGTTVQPLPSPSAVPDPHPSVGVS